MTKAPKPQPDTEEVVRKWRADVHATRARARTRVPLKPGSVVKPLPGQLTIDGEEVKEP